MKKIEIKYKKTEQKLRASVFFQQIEIFEVVEEEDVGIINEKWHRK